MLTRLSTIIPHLLQASSAWGNCLSAQSSPSVQSLLPAASSPQQQQQPPPTQSVGPVAGNSCEKVQFVAEGAVNGPLGQLTNGQVRVGTNLTAGAWRLSNHTLYDSTGRICSWVGTQTVLVCRPPEAQAAAAAQSMYVDCNGYLKRNSGFCVTNDFYVCWTGDHDQVNLYLYPLDSMCRRVRIKADGGGCKCTYPTSFTQSLCPQDTAMVSGFPPPSVFVPPSPSPSSTFSSGGGGDHGGSTSAEPTTSTSTLTATIATLTVTTTIATLTVTTTIATLTVTAAIATLTVIGIVPTSYDGAPSTFTTSIYSPPFPSPSYLAGSSTSSIKPSYSGGMVTVHR